MAANYVLLERIELNASAASVTFSNIPQSGYTDLKVEISGRSTVAQLGASIYMRFNGSGSTVNTIRNLYGNGSAAASQNNAGADAWSGIDADGANASANIYSNTSIYFPNYTVSQYKSWSADSVIENNATSAYCEIAAGVWASTSSISSITFTIENASGNWSSNSTFSLYGISAVGTTPVIAPKASGGNITTDGTYWYHAFLTSGAFTPQTSLSCDILAVAGGGGGGDYGAGAGGAGGVIYWASQALTTSAQAITIGAGGANNASGTNTTFASLTAAVGGGKGSNANGTSGGSGGGGGYSGGAAGTSTQTGTGATAYYGNSSGTSGSGIGGGGGGGAGAVGSNGSSSAGMPGGAGGAGINTYSSWLSATGLGVSGYIAGGGGGGSNTSSGAAGGSGGGGVGGFGTSPYRATNATASTGSGGGGGGYAGTSPEYSGGNGAGGLVIIRYAMA